MFAEEDDDEAAAVDPMADLFFTLVALILPAILLMLPVVGLASGTFPEPSRRAAEALLTADLRVGGLPPAAFVASAEGLTIGGDVPRLITVDALFGDAVIANALAAARNAGAPVLLLVEPGGEESAFLFDSLAAEHGPPAITQVRLDDRCAFARSAPVADACAGRASGAAP
jgi:hypothetical protein